MSKLFERLSCNRSGALAVLRAATALRCAKPAAAVGARHSRHWRQSADPAPASAAAAAASAAPTFSQHNSMDPNSPFLQSTEGYQKSAPQPK